jgi:hypothetical protein
MFAHRQQAAGFQQLALQGDKAVAARQAGDLTGRVQVFHDQCSPQQVVGQVDELGMFARDEPGRRGHQPGVRRQFSRSDRRSFARLSVIR